MVVGCQGDLLDVSLRITNYMQRKNSSFQCILYLDAVSEINKHVNLDTNNTRTVARTGRRAMSG